MQPMSNNEYAPGDRPPPADAASNMPYGFGGGSWTMPRGNHTGNPYSEINTNGVIWGSDGSVIDESTRIGMAFGDCCEDD